MQRLKKSLVSPQLKKVKKLELFCAILSHELYRGAALNEAKSIPVRLFAGFHVSTRTIFGKI